MLISSYFVDIHLPASGFIILDSSWLKFQRLTHSHRLLSFSSMVHSKPTLQIKSTILELTVESIFSVELLLEFCSLVLFCWKPGDELLVLFCSYIDLDSEHRG